ncbi:Crp/Fnr family transcriptional regulator [Companilactobacillus allii]|uniref:Crp/Fnr family transcriptional regulator n=1 Tax=Companilactobacillus allii TaxID=1847728 RepID=A0A1P8Q1L0_9LACO|nr:Crp/Fnr family transcriptional regulator [Companilactobacillus allii]APX71711.1 Crp/Fnr family transcriptional regulator [Companilactobacillus allii]USQ68799.1 Crp/Fnr family transcriptional regulator [Companilactobacillus allii]
MAHLAHNHTAEDCVELVTIFQSLSKEDTKTVASLVSDKHYQSGEYIYQAGNSADALTIVAHGQAKVFQIATNGKEQMLRILQTGDFDGEAALFSNKDRTSFAQALMDTDVCQIKRSDFQKLMKTSPELAVNMVNAFGQRIVQLEQQTTEAATSSIESRLASYLLETSAGLKKEQFELPLKKKDIATYLGTTPETISRKLSSLAKDELIEKKSNTLIKILDADGLAMVE